MQWEENVCINAHETEGFFCMTHLYIAQWQSNYLDKCKLSLGHPIYSLDLSPPDIFLFPQPNRFLEGHIVSAGKITPEETLALRGVLKNDFQECNQKLSKC
jgi:hypothetical protein